MSPKWKTALLWSYRILLSLSIVVAGICLATQCLMLYRSAEHPFTPESVALAFSQIALPVYLCLFLIVLGLFLKPLLPCPRCKPEKNYSLILSRLEATTDLNACPRELEAQVLRLLATRAVVQYAGLGLLAAGSVIFLFYGADPSNFGSDINCSMVNAMTWLIACMAVPFGFGIFAACHRKKSIQAEIALLRSAPAEARCTPEPEPVKKDNTQLLRFGIAALALVLIVLGFFLDGASDVLTKAVNICTECIGLG